MTRRANDVARPPAPFHTTRRVPGLEIQTVAEVLGVARCPCCHAPLVLRVDRWGPYFQCLCAESAFGRRRR